MRFIYPFFLLTAACFLTSAKSTKMATEKPNVVLVFADDMGFECLGTYGGASYSTPNLDKLAKDGIRFENCHSMPRCAPSRAQIMTGRHNFRNYRGFNAYPRSYVGSEGFEYTFANILGNAGYATCVAGKWQMDFSKVKAAGFDEYCLHDQNKTSCYWDPTVRYHDRPTVTRTGEYGPDIFCNFLLDFIEREKDGPFLAYLSMNLPHFPWLPTPDTPGPYPESDKHVDYAAPNYKDRMGDTKYFADNVAYVDKLVGRIVAKLEELGLSENTLILFTADNGSEKAIDFSRLEDGTVVLGGKSGSRDGGSHVPLVGKWPAQVTPGTVCSDLINFSDFLPTFAEAGEGTIPEGRVLDGISFLPRLKGQKGTPRTSMFVWYQESWFSRFPNSARVWARTTRYKLYNTNEFYDVVADLNEQNNIAPGTGTPEAEKARRELAKFMRDMIPTVDKYRSEPTPQPDMPD